MRPSLAFALLALAPDPAAAQAASVEVLPDRATLVAGARLPLRAVARDAADREVGGRRVQWTALPADAVSVDTAGLVTAWRPGLARIIATVDGRQGLAEIVIEPGPPATLEVVPEQPVIVVGGSTILRAVARTDDGDPLPGTVFTFRSSDPRVATVDPVGVVTGRGEGSAIFAVQVGDLRAEVRVQVVANRVGRLMVQGPVQARAGDVVRLRASGEDRRNLPVPNPPVRWSVSDPTAEIGPDGAFVATRAGTYLVTAAAGPVAATHAIRVMPRPGTAGLEVARHLPLGDAQPIAVAPAGDLLYVATWGPRLYVFDARDPAAPVKADSVTLTGGPVTAFAVSGDGRVAAAARTGGIAILDLADPRRPRPVGDIGGSMAGGARALWFDGRDLYAAETATGALRIISLEDPGQPRERGVWAMGSREGQPPAPRFLWDVTVHDGLAWLAMGRDGVVALDVGKGIRDGSPATPRVVSQYIPGLAGRYPPEMSIGVRAAVRHGQYLFLAEVATPANVDLSRRDPVRGLGRVLVLDATDPAEPVPVAEYRAGEAEVAGLRVEGDTLYVAHGAAGLRALDVSGTLRGDLAAQGREIGSVWTGGAGGFRANLPMARDVRRHGPVVYVADLNSGVWVVKGRDGRE